MIRWANMNAIILSTGTELTTGQCVDTNSAWLSAALGRFGVRVIRHVTVGDDIQDIRQAMGEALDSTDLVVATGGLGPTADDLTRDALAEAIEQPLEENAEALGQIRAIFERWQRPWHEANRVQAMIPRGCTVIPNPRGTAPGIWYHTASTDLFVLPGVPAEMRAMFAAAVVPVVEKRCGGARTERARLPCFGISEAKLGELIQDLMVRGRNPLVGTTASGGVISVRLVAWGKDEAEAKRLLADDISEVRRRLGSVVFGERDDTLEGVVGQMLLERHLTIATAESCTGGLLAKRLTDVPGSSAYFLRGYVTYANEAKSELLGVPPELIMSKGAVSEEVAAAMATGCRAAAGSDLGVGITGIAGPTGGQPPEKPVGLVYIALADSGGVEVKRILFGEHLVRSEIRDRACKTALNLIRLRL